MMMVNILLITVSINGKSGKMDGLYGKVHLELDDDWGYPYFRKKHPFVNAPKITIKSY